MTKSVLDLRTGRLFGIWSWFALLGILTVLVLFAAPISSVIDGAGPLGSNRWLWAVAITVIWLVITAAGTGASHAMKAKNEPLKPLERYSSAVSVLLLIGILAPLARMTLHFTPQGNETAAARFLETALEPAWNGLGRAGELVGLPEMMAGVPTAPVLFFVLLIFVRNALHWRIDRLRMGLYREGPAAPKERRTEQETDEARARVKAIERRLAVASYTEAKSLLQTTQIELSFVSLDVVGSTSMKQGEDPYVVEQSFSEYRRLVEGALRKFGAYKQTWTPDGQMAAFKQAQSAVDCAKEVLKQLDEFNRTRSKLRRPFRVRAGANVGMVSTDDRTPMEEISDFSIDVAGHMQKYAEPDMLWISEDLYKRLEDPAGFDSTGKEVDGRRVFAWKKEE